MMSEGDVSARTICWKEKMVLMTSAPVKVSTRVFGEE